MDVSVEDQRVAVQARSAVRGLLPGAGREPEQREKKFHCNPAPYYGCPMQVSRRAFVAAGLGSLARRGAAREKPRVAAIVTEYRHNSHADVICGRILQGYRPNDVPVEPRTRIVSMYTDQIAREDMSRRLAARHGFTIHPSVAEALTLGGGRLAVDAVLLVGEHGDYPTNERGQKLYPRFELFEKIVGVFRKSGRSVPLFCDKHLSYDWEKARTMVHEARELGFPFMAGSSIPLTVRTPHVALEIDAPLEHAVAVGYGGLESYGFHTLEALQSMIERRAGGEKGIAAVEALEGEAVWKWSASDAGRWSAGLLEAALACSANAGPGKPEESARRPAVFVLEYRDGFRAAAYMLDGHARDFLFACSSRGRQGPLACRFGLASGRPLPHFDGLVRCIEEMFVSRRPVHPVERTLLTTGALAFLLESRHRGVRIETPELRIAYHPPKDPWYQRA